MLVRGASPATRGLVGLLAAIAAGAMLLAGCSGGNGSPIASGTSGPTQGAGGSSGSEDGGEQEEPSEAPPQPKPSPKAKIEIKPATGASEVELDTPVTVSVIGGELTKVSVKDAKGETLAGQLNPTKSTWTSTDGLSEEATYQVAATAVDAEGLATSASNSFTTMDVSKSDVLETNIEPDGQTVGVGMPIVIKFSDDVENKAGVEKKLKVVTSKPVEGAWRWFGDEEVHWRPKSYWPAFTDVSVHVDLKGVPSGEGDWGIKNKVKHFSIGRSVIHKVNLSDHHLRSYVNGKLAKTIPVSGGKAGWRTRVGTKIILQKRTNLHFTDEQIDADDNYDLTAAYGVRVTWSGEFLHSADWSRANHGVRNGSHGCVGMSTKNSRWIYNNSLVGDPVEVVGGGGSQMPVWGNGLGDWNMSWNKWQQAKAS
ncbi:L,D-transpeptidase family protein [Tenggerimyces flavus]|uniref:Ig-like domain-containing protein n=1 Tax=Tenggerimyces flavus TaxID=1708749 RepID=A0ABV7YN56_9ACTN|nr:lipoprotein-anchoring transpeptidase ErfK/SrfK [Tenggerimyces flavus]